MELNPSHGMERLPVVLPDLSRGAFAFNAPFRREDGRIFFQRAVRCLAPPLARPPQCEKGRLIDLYA
jgi:hypothetical protein